MFHIVKLIRSAPRWTDFRPKTFLPSERWILYSRPPNHNHLRFLSLFLPKCSFSFFLCVLSHSETLWTYFPSFTRVAMTLLYGICLPQPGFPGWLSSFLSFFPEVRPSVMEEKKRNFFQINRFMALF